MQNFPSLNAEFFDQHVAERLNQQALPPLLIRTPHSRLAAESTGRLLTTMCAGVDQCLF